MAAFFHAAREDPDVLLGTANFTFRDGEENTETVPAIRSDPCHDRCVPDGGTAIVLDCRWLGFSGIGRVTASLLDGFREIGAEGEWLLWGPKAVEAFLWSNAAAAITDRSPVALAG